jgi:hypothetical protein
MQILNKLEGLDNIEDGTTRKLITKVSKSGDGNVMTSIEISGDTLSYNTANCVASTSIVDSISSSSSSAEIPSAKAVYDYIQSLDAEETEY